MDFPTGTFDKHLTASQKELHIAMHYGKQGESVCSINKFSLWAALQERWVSVNTYLKTPPTHHLVIVDHTWWLKMIIHRFFWKWLWDKCKVWDVACTQNTKMIQSWISDLKIFVCRDNLNPPCLTMILLSIFGVTKVTKSFHCHFRTQGHIDQCRAKL